MNDYELMHYGVKGMKWGVRKARPSLEAQRDAAKARYKDAKKAYNRAFNRADARSIAVFSPFKKHRENNDKRWADVAEKAKALNEAKDAYKTAKKAVRADSKARKAAEKALAKAEKQRYKEFVKTRSKEILAGESVAARIWDVITDGHKYQAEIEYNLTRKGY